MKRILLISDSHGYLDPKLAGHIASCDEVWHAGDIGSLEICRQIEAGRPLRAVYGNIDGPEIRTRYPENLIFDCEGLKVAITHIAGSPGKYPARVKQLLRSEKPSLFICGHSHILKVMYDKEMGFLFMNPGACGVQGFHNVKTAIKFVVENGSVKQPQVIELGKRNSLA